LACFESPSQKKKQNTKTSIFYCINILQPSACRISTPS
jgi:hypothetical protein